MCSDEVKSKVKKTAKNYMLEYFKTVESSSDVSYSAAKSDCSVESFKMRRNFKQKVKKPSNKHDFQTLLKNEFECYANTPWEGSYTFWCTNQLRFPNLSKFARIVLSEAVHPKEHFRLRVLKYRQEEIDWQLRVSKN